MVTLSVNVDNAWGLSPPPPSLSFPKTFSALCYLFFIFLCFTVLLHGMDVGPETMLCFCGRAASAARHLGLVTVLASSSHQSMTVPTDKCHGNQGSLVAWRGGCASHHLPGDSGFSYVTWERAGPHLHPVAPCFLACSSLWLRLLHEELGESVLQWSARVGQAEIPPLWQYHWHSNQKLANRVWI